jgi:hypothetical protein
VRLTVTGALDSARGARGATFGWRFDSRIEESSGQVRWRTTNTTTFTTLHTVSHSETLSGLKLEFSGSDPAQPATTTAFEIDSLNLGP